MPTVLKLKVVFSDEWLNVHSRPRIWPFLGERGGLPPGEGFPLMEFPFQGPGPAQAGQSQRPHEIGLRDPNL